MNKTWKGLRLGINDKLQVYEYIAREKDAAYVYMQLGNISEMVKKLSIVARMQNKLSSLSGKEAPAFYDFESSKNNVVYSKTPVCMQKDKFDSNF